MNEPFVISAASVGAGEPQGCGAARSSDGLILRDLRMNLNTAFWSADYADYADVEGRAPFKSGTKPSQLGTPSSSINLRNLRNLRTTIAAFGMKGGDFRLSGSSRQVSESFRQVNGSFVGANGSSVQVNGSFVEADGSSVQGNGSFVEADGSFVQVNGSFVEADGSFVQVNGSFVEADGSSVQVNGSFVEANVSSVQTSGSSVDADGAFVQTRGSLVDSDEFSGKTDRATGNANGLINSNAGIVVRRLRRFAQIERVPGAIALGSFFPVLECSSALHLRKSAQSADEKAAFGSNMQHGSLRRAA